MENVLVAVVIIFLVLFGVLTLSTAFLNAQEDIYSTWEAVQHHEADIAATRLTGQSLRVLEAGALVEVLLTNSGSTRLADFDRWDVIIEYCTEAVPSLCQSHYLTYSNLNPVANEWGVANLYESNGEDAERYDLGILNPGEVLMLRLRLPAAIAVGGTARVAIVTPNGVVLSIGGNRNQAPVLEQNRAIRTAIGGTTAITTADLSASDVDSPAEEVVFSVFTAPTQGSLSLGSEFSQAQLEAGDVVYTHSGSIEDMFEFFVGDGINVTGPYRVDVTLNTAPTLEANTGLVVPLQSSSFITSAMLRASDVDAADVAERLVFTITQFPSNGTLNLGSSFTQADVDANRLLYTHRDNTADLFRFVVSDGYDVIGEFTFVITTI